LRKKGGGVAVDLRKVKKLIELVEESAIAELEVTSGDESVRIVMHRGVASPSVITPMASPVMATTPARAGANTTKVDSPMAGTFYRGSNPEATPFVEVGQSVSPGDVLCIIESMKMMHEIRASVGGTVAQICVDNAQPIGTGDTLFKLS
jgi:acetyl-CoA carboxylase biotin carboxyl carrier protein